MVAYLPSAGAQAGTAPSGGPMRARITGAAIPYTSHATTGSKAAPAGLPNPSLLKLSPGRHTVQLGSMLLTATATFTSL